MLGRDTNNLSTSEVNGLEYLSINKFRYVEAAAAVEFQEIAGTVVINHETIWIDISAGLGGHIVNISAPQNGSWFVYDDKMNCIATSLERHPRETIILPDNGRLALAGDPGAEFVIMGGNSKG
jgi:hypothetical protein